MINFFLNLQIFAMSWSAILKLGDWAPFPVVLLFCTVITSIVKTIFYLLNAIRVALKFEYVDAFILIGLSLILLSVIFFPTTNGPNYLLAYSALFGSILVICTLCKGSVGQMSILRANYYGVNFICCYVCIEVVGRFVIGESPFDWIPRSREASATVTYGLFRAYGLSTEPTQVGNYFVCFMPYAIYYAGYKSKRMLAPYLFFLCVSAIFTFSASMFVVGSTAALLYFILCKEKIIFLKQVILVFGGLILLCILLITYFDLLSLFVGVYETISGKLTLSDGGTSSNQRLSLLRKGYSDIQSNPIFGTGIGTAGSQNIGSNINWYVFLAAEGGLIILGVFVAWFGLHLAHAAIAYLQTTNDFYLVSCVSLYSGMAYLLFLSTFQNLFLLSVIMIYRLLLPSKGSAVRGYS